MAVEPSHWAAGEPEDPALESYYRVLATMAETGHRLATEPPEAEVADLLRQRGVEPTPEVIDVWYARWHRRQQREARPEA